MNEKTCCKDIGFDGHAPSCKNGPEQNSDLNDLLVGKTVICASRKWCRYSSDCGGAVKHTFDENECGKCPMNENAKCVECA